MLFSFKFFLTKCCYSREALWLSLQLTQPPTAGLVAPGNKHSYVWVQVKYHALCFSRGSQWTVGARKGESIRTPWILKTRLDSCKQWSSMTNILQRLVLSTVNDLVLALFCKLDEHVQNDTAVVCQCSVYFQTQIWLNDDSHMIQPLKCALQS